MPITALPQNTARAITSTLALNDAASVVKELVDNALDAKASSVTIEISSSTLDVIQVKDNGFGIGVEDRQLLCKRGCTSKIRTIEDLALLGGTFLGFRGEALASVAELSTSVALTTRVEGEVVGTTLKFGPSGKLLSSSSASHPVGTTVRIQDFLTNIPVRKQTALKSASKTLVGIRKLIQAYALARSEVRLSLKVLKAKDGKANWSYAPSKAAASLLEAASKVAGKEVAAQCTQHDVNNREDGAAFETASYNIRAALVSPTSDVTKACHAEQYCSVDGRPVASDKGLIKELVSTYKKHLRSALNAAGSGANLTKPFICLQISCPLDSYDVNVEPAKDEVLFYKSSTVGGLFKQILLEAYGEVQESGQEESVKGLPKDRARETGAFDVLLARKTVPELPVPSQGHREDVVKSADAPPNTMSSRSLAGPLITLSVTDEARTSSALRNVTGNNTNAHTNMFSVDDGDTVSDASKDPVATGEEDLDLSDGQDESPSNPWIMAKMNTRTAAHSTGVSNAANAEAATQLSSSSSPQRPQSSSHRTPLGHTSQLPSPAHSHEDVPYQNPGPPLRRRAYRVEDDEPDLSASGILELGDPNKSSSLLDTWIQKQNSSQNLPPSGMPTTDTEELVHVHHQAMPQPRQTTLSSGQRPHGQQRRPFKSPFKRSRLSQSSTSSSDLYEEQDQIEGHTAQVSAAPGLTTSRVSLRPSPCQQLQSSNNRQELDEILEFERQKRLAIAQHRKQAIQSTIGRPLSTPSPSQIGVARPHKSLAPETVRGHPQLDASVTPSQENFEGRFGQRDQQVEDPRQRQRNNPHHNRFLAATRNLDTPRIDDRPGDGEATRHAPQAVQDGDLKMPDSDPRAYLIRQKEQGKAQDTTGTNGLVRTTLKLKRTKTSQLPLETVPINSAIHDLTADFKMDLAIVRSEMTTLLPLDEYVKTGTIDAQQWLLSALDLARLQVNLQNLVKKSFRSGDVHGSDTDAEDEAAALKIDLDMALKAHIHAM